MANKQAFFYSAVAALSIYLIIILSFLVYMKTHKVKKIQASTKNTVLQLDVILEAEKLTPIKTPKKIETINKKIAEKVVKKTTSVSAKQRTNLKSLFANVKTNVTKVKKEKVMNVKKNSISSRFKSKFEKEKKTKKIVLSKLSEKIETKKQVNKKNISMEKSKDKQDPYYSKIYQMLSDRWIPTVFSDSLKSKVNIVIFNNGKFSYKFIQYSGNTGFDNQLRSFLNNESLKEYPISPTKKTVNIEITFQSKG